MAYKIAVTTTDGEHIDVHFGMARSFLILEVTEEDGSCQKVEERPLDEEVLRRAEADPDRHGCSAGSETVLDHIGELLKDCTYLLTAKIGNRPHRGLQQRGINALEAPYGIGEAVSKLNSYYRSHKKREQHIF